MTKRHSILQKKLKELESILNYLLSLPPETPYYDHQLYAPDIENRIEFVRKLLSAEISSSAQPRKPYQLQQIARRLTELESIFKEWDSIKALTVVEHFDPVVSTTCSSCLNNNNDDGDGEGKGEGEGDGDVSPDSYEGLREDDDDDDEAANRNNAIVEKHDDVKKEERRRIRVYGKYVGVMGAGVVIGMAFMGVVIVKFSGCFNCVEPRAFLLPPT